MKKPIEELDLDFDNTMSGLYVVYDITSNMDVSDVIMARNDAMAVEAFKQFVSDVKEKNKYSKFAIRNLGTYSHMSHRIVDGGEYDIVNDTENLEEYSQQIYDFINREDDKDDDDVYRDSKCDYCNSAMHDCSLCGSNVEG